MSEPGENLAVNVNRCVLNQEVFDQRFLNEKNEEKKTLGESGVKLMKKSFNPAKFLNIFSILNVITSYNFKNCLVADIISGLTVGIMQIPQALAYGSLTSLNPVHGLYTSFYPSLTYVIFGSSRHLSVGTFALVSLMVYGSVSRVEGEFMIDKQLILDPSNETLMEGVMYVTENELNEFRIRVATGLCFWCGIIQLIFAFFRFGFVTKYLSKPMLRGFNSAAAFHVFATQMQHVFGIYIKSKPRRILKLVF